MNKENREEIENCKKEVEVLKKIVDEMLKTKSLERVDKLFDSAVKKLDRIYFLSLKNLLDKKF